MTSNNMNWANNLRVLAFCISVGLWSVSGSAQNGGPSFLTNGLVAYYPFDGNGIDASGNGNNANLTTGTFIADRFGVPMHAIDFSVPESGVAGAITTKLQSPGNLFSLALWFKASRGNGGQLISFGDSPDGHNAQSDRNIEINASTGQLDFYIYDSGLAVYLTTTNAAVIDGQWHSAVVTLSPSGMALYLDGGLAATNPSETRAQNYSGYWQIGNIVASIDEVRIYNRLLSAQEIAMLYGFESTPPEPGQAMATATVVNGFVVGVTVTNGGKGYPAPPEVLFSGGGGSGATAIATVTNGVVNQIIVQTAGNGYLTTPFVTIAPPPLAGTSFLTNGLVAYYPFNGTANDESGTGNNGTVTAAALAKDRFGVPNSAFAFDGISSLISVPDSPSLRIPGDITVAVWVQLTQTNVGVRFLGKGSGTFRNYGLFYDTPATPALLFQQFPPSGGNVCQENTAAFISWTPGQWYHIVGLRLGGVAKIYVNGALLFAHSFTCDPHTSTGNDPLLIGAPPPGDSNYSVLNGSIDDVRIYNRGLSDMEVKALYDYESTPQTAIPRRASGTVTVVNGFVVGVILSDAGLGYTNAPAVRIIGAGSGATAIATVANGQVAQIIVTSAGIGYATNTTQMLIDPPPKLPSLAIAVETVRLTFSVWQGEHYVIESSADLKTWGQLLDLIADADTVVRDFQVANTGMYFRIREVP